jgi:hypothetical protein
VYAIGLAVEVVVFPGRNFPSHRRKKERNIKAKSTETCFLRITFSQKIKKKKTLFRMDRWLSVGIISQKQRKDGHHKR